MTNLPRAQSGRPSYELHSLGWSGFQDLCGTILADTWGQTFQIFTAGNDAGRDGAFHGKWTSGKAEFVGSVTVQCKFSADPSGAITPSSLADEISKAQRLSDKGLADNYVLMTNCRMTGEREEQLRKLFPFVKGRFAAYGYGTWPDQRRPYFTLRDLRITLASATKGAGIEGAIYAGLEACVGDLLGRRWQRDDGAALAIERLLIDANWGQSTDVIYQFCRQSPHAAIVMPSHGRFVGAASVPFNDYQRKRGDRVGHHWRIPGVVGKRTVRHLLYDTNFWKTFIHARLAVPMGDPGCLSLFGQDAERHRLLSEHLTAEYRIRTTGRGREVDEWKLRPEGLDNHWLDGAVGCAAAASMMGAVLAGTESAAKVATKPRVRLSQLRRAFR